MQRCTIVSDRADCESIDSSTKQYNVLFIPYGISKVRHIQIQVFVVKWFHDSFLKTNQFSLSSNITASLTLDFLMHLHTSTFLIIYENTVEFSILTDQKISKSFL